MPELPEVEVVCRSLKKIFNDHGPISHVSWSRPDLRFSLPLRLLKSWKEVQVLQVERRAKYLRLESAASSLVCHLGMSGSFRLIDRSEARQKHDHVEFHFSGGKVLVFNDPRRFGFFLEWPGSWQLVSRQELGIEPLGPQFNAAFLLKVLSGKEACIKALLMDQKNVVGIGNIYASEILFRSRILPTRPGHRIKKDDAQRIVHETKVVLRSAIRQGGSSIRDFHSPESGAGSFQQSHFVYGREGKPCIYCGEKIRSRRISGRSTFWCPNCQS